MMRDNELAGLAMTLGRDARIRVTVGGETSYCKPDGSHINIARMPATPLGRMLMTGLVFHEVAHKNHTQGERPPGLLGEMTNVIEDVRVEAQSIRERPGTRFDLEAVTNYYAQKGALAPSDIPTALLGLAMAYGRGVVLGQQAILHLLEPCRDKLAAAFGRGFMAEVEKILERDFPVLTSTGDARDMAQRLVGVLLRGRDSRKGKQSFAETGSKNGQPGEEQRTSGKENSEEEIAGSTPKEGKEGKAPGQNAPGESRAGSPGEKETFPECPTQEEITRMLQAGTGGYGDLSSLMTRDLDALARNVTSSRVQEIPLLPAVGRVKPNKGRLDEAQAISICSRMRARLMTLLQAQKLLTRAYGSSGRRLARGQRLVRMALGDPRIFCRKTPEQAPDTAVVVLLDTSGSMIGEGESGLRRFEVANPAAFALHHALSGIAGVQVASAEFSSRHPRIPEVNLLSDFGEKPRSEAFNLDPDGGTPTHSALWYARAALLQRPEARKIILVVSDGRPADHDQTLAATKRCLRESIEIGAIGIETDAVKRFWKNHRTITRLPDLPQEMFAMMEGLLLGRPINIALQER